MSYMNLYVIVPSLHIIFLSISIIAGINKKSDMLRYYPYVFWNGMESGSSNNPTLLVTLKTRRLIYRTRSIQTIPPGT